MDIIYFLLNLYKFSGKLTNHSSGDKITHDEMTFRGNKKIGPMIIETVWVSISFDHGLGEVYISYKKSRKTTKIKNGKQPT